jgi:hypothetical protein
VVAADWQSGVVYFLGLVGHVLTWAHAEGIQVEAVSRDGSPLTALARVAADAHRRDQGPPWVFEVRLTVADDPAAGSELEQLRRVGQHWVVIGGDWGGWHIPPEPMLFRLRWPQLVP